MEALIQKVAPATERHTFAVNPFQSSDVYFKVAPRFFSVLPHLPSVSRDIMKFISLNITDGKVYLPTTSLLVHTKVKSEELIRAGIDALIEHEVLALCEGDCYWVNFIEPTLQP